MGKPHATLDSLPAASVPEQIKQVYNRTIEREKMSL